MDTSEGIIVVKVSPVCPECHSTMKADEEHDAWTEAETFIVVPLYCPRCDYSGCLHVSIDLSRT